MQRRDFIKAVAGSAMTWPLVVRAQQAMPVIGLLTPVLQIEEHLRGFQQGLQRAGFVDGDNVSILYRSAENEMDRLPALANRYGSPRGRSNRSRRSAGGVRSQECYRD